MSLFTNYVAIPALGIGLGFGLVFALTGRQLAESAPVGVMNVPRPGSGRDKAMPPADTRMTKSEFLRATQGMNWIQLQQLLALHSKMEMEYGHNASGSGNCLTGFIKSTSTVYTGPFTAAITDTLSPGSGLCVFQQ